VKRLWFKAAMKYAILQCHKSATTRINPLKVGECYQAVSGSRFKAEPFAVLQITSRRKVEDLTYHCTNHFRQEGFSSPVAMGEYISKNLPEYVHTRPLYYHTFKEVQHP
jgi:hypothetical protein